MGPSPLPNLRTYFPKTDNNLLIDRQSKRYKKYIENSDRVLKITGILPMTKDGWEKAAVILMDMLDEERTKNTK